MTDWERVEKNIREMSEEEFEVFCRTMNELADVLDQEGEPTPDDYETNFIRVFVSELERRITNGKWKMDT